MEVVWMPLLLPLHSEDGHLFIFKSPAFQGTLTSRGEPWGIYSQTAHHLPTPRGHNSKFSRAGCEGALFGPCTAAAPQTHATHAPLSPPQSQPKHFPSHSYEGDVFAFLQKKTDHLQEKIIQVIRTIWSHKSHFPTPGREYFPKDLHE